MTFVLNFAKQLHGSKLIDLILSRRPEQGLEQ